MRSSDTSAGASASVLQLLTVCAPDSPNKITKPTFAPAVMCSAQQWQELSLSGAPTKVCILGPSTGMYILQRITAQPRGDLDIAKIQGNWSEYRTDAGKATPFFTCASSEMEHICVPDLRQRHKEFSAVEVYEAKPADPMFEQANLEASAHSNNFYDRVVVKFGEGEGVFSEYAKEFRSSSNKFLDLPSSSPGSSTGSSPTMSQGECEQVYSFRDKVLEALPSSYGVELYAHKAKLLSLLIDYRDNGAESARYPAIVENLIRDASKVETDTEFNELLVKLWSRFTFIQCELNATQEVRSKFCFKEFKDQDQIRLNVRVMPEQVDPHKWKERQISGMKTFKNNTIVFLLNLSGDIDHVYMVKDGNYQEYGFKVGSSFNLKEQYKSTIKTRDIYKDERYLNLFQCVDFHKPIGSPVPFAGADSSYTASSVGTDSFASGSSGHAPVDTIHTGAGPSSLTAGVLPTGRAAAQVILGPSYYSTASNHSTPSKDDSTASNPSSECGDDDSIRSICTQEIDEAAKLPVAGDLERASPHLTAARLAARNAGSSQGDTDGFERGSPNLTRVRLAASNAGGTQRDLYAMLQDEGVDKSDEEMKKLTQRILQFFADKVREGENVIQRYAPPRAGAMGPTPNPASADEDPEVKKFTRIFHSTLTTPAPAPAPAPAAEGMAASASVELNFMATAASPS